MTPDCKLQSWVQIQQSPQPTVDCQSLDGLPSGMALCCRLSSEGRQRSIYKKHQKQFRKKKKKNILGILCSFASLPPSNYKSPDGSAIKYIPPSAFSQFRVGILLGKKIRLNRDDESWFWSRELDGWSGGMGWGLGGGGVEAEFFN